MNLFKKLRSKGDESAPMFFLNIEWQWISIIQETP